jgi:hypothetical protein
MGQERQMDRNTRQSGLLNNQIRSLGTTIRYFISGFAVYGFMGAIQNLKALQDQLGTLAAIGTTMQGQPLPTDSLNRMRDDILRISTDIGQPAEDIANSINTIYSSLQNISPSQASSIARTFSQLALVTGAQDVNQTGTALISTMGAFGIPAKNAKNVASEIFRFIQLSMQFRGENFAQFTPQAFAGAQMAGVSLPQLLAMLTIVSRSGGTAATTSRHVGQLLRNLRTPPKEAQKFFDQIGLSQQELTTLPPMQILQRMFTAVRAAGIQGKPQTLAPGQEFDPEATGTEGLKGPGAVLLANLLRRAEARRAFFVLMQGFQGRPNAAGWNELVKQIDEAGKNTDKYTAAVKRASDQRTITIMQNAWRNFFTSIITEAEPVFSVLKNLGQAATDFTLGPAGHRHRLGLIGGGIGAGLGLLALNRFTQGRFSPLRAFGAGGALLSAAQAMETGDTARGSSPTNPLWVAISYSLAGPGGGGGLIRDAERAGKDIGGGYLGSRLFRLGRGLFRGNPEEEVARALGRRGLFGIGGITAGVALADVGTLLSIPGASGPTRHGHPLLNYLLAGRAGHAIEGGPRAIREAMRRGYISHELGQARLREYQIIQAGRHGYISAETAERRLRAVATRSQLSAAGTTRIPMDLLVNWGNKPLKIEITAKDRHTLNQGGTVQKRLKGGDPSLFQPTIVTAPTKKRSQHK